MVLTESEFKSDVDKWFAMLDQEDVYVMRDDEMVAKITGPESTAVNSLFGMLRHVGRYSDIDVVREERILDYKDNA